MENKNQKKYDTHFYLEIETGVRELVQILRNHGVNTECSCHHDWYVQCQTVDPTTELRRIADAMDEAGVRKYVVKLEREVIPDCGIFNRLDIEFAPTEKMEKAKLFPK